MSNTLDKPTNQRSDRDRVRRTGWRIGMGVAGFLIVTLVSVLMWSKPEVDLWRTIGYCLAPSAIAGGTFPPLVQTLFVWMHDVLEELRSR